MHNAHTDDPEFGYRYLAADASAAETLDTYSHLWPDLDDHTREAVDAAWSGALVATSWPRLIATD